MYTNRTMRLQRLLLLTVLSVSAAQCQNLDCDLSEYKPLEGLTAEAADGGLRVNWRGERGRQLRAIFAIRGGQPLVHELAIRTSSYQWAILARDVTPEFEVTTGRRRMSEQQLAPLRKLNINLTPELLDREKWKAFWDAPLDIPGNKGANLDLPRTQAEIHRAHATYHSTTCRVKTDGARLEVTFPGLSMGIFTGELRFTVYAGANLLRQEAIAKTDEQSVAYKYNAGLKGFSINDATRVIWQDAARAWQKYEFGGATNDDPVVLRARNRLTILETGNGSLAVFPPPHKFFFARENEVNLGYVYYRKDTIGTSSLGAMQPERRRICPLGRH